MGAWFKHSEGAWPWRLLWRLLRCPGENGPISMLTAAARRSNLPQTPGLPQQSPQPQLPCPAVSVWSLPPALLLAKAPILLLCRSALDQQRGMGESFHALVVMHPN